MVTRYSSTPGTKVYINNTLRSQFIFVHIIHFKLLVDFQCWKSLLQHQAILYLTML